MAPAEQEEHSQHVAELLAAFAKERNRRVPITFASDEHLWLSLTDNSFRQFYLDPRVNLEVQLTGLKWLLDNVVHDRVCRYPDVWRAAPRDWMFENTFFGTEIRYQDNDYAWARPLALAKEDLIRALRDLDTEQRIRDSLLWRLYTEMKELAADMQFAERKVEISTPGQGTHGPFTTACALRGSGQLCMDVAEDPDFVRSLLEAITEKTLERMRFWLALDGVTDTDLPQSQDRSLSDDAIQMLSPEAYERLVLPCHEHLYSALTTGKRMIHLCGRAMQHYPLLYHKLGVTHIDGPGAFADHGKFLAEMPALSLAAQMQHTCLISGPDSAIERMLGGILSKTAKQPGRFQLMGFITAATPMANVRTAYELGKDLGVIE